ncbi:MAG: 23S rRNA (guanosine(2251)-2'-O)-methyltransferase RlmB [Clostridia bacterium]|nr:23S rRNA (guanosine(2251)-2'-O)-methyltransferase RlmB [Clostridia bacterium]
MEQLDSQDTAGDAGLIEGRNAVWEALQSGRQLDKILIAQGAQNLGHILSAARAAGVAIQECDRRKLDKLSITGSHQGIMAQGAAAEYKTIDDILELAASRGEKPLLVLCDGLTDPHNLGAIIRSCEVLGGHGVVVPRHRSAGLNAACAKAAAGALEHLPVAKCANMSTAINELKEKGVFILAADMGGQPAAKIDFDMPCAVVIGAEGSGVSEGVRKAADLIVSIPQKGNIQSLNASNAAAILLYEAVRQRG